MLGLESFLIEGFGQELFRKRKSRKRKASGTEFRQKNRSIEKKRKVMNSRRKQRAVVKVGEAEEQMLLRHVT